MNELSRWYENMTYQEAKDILREKLDNMKINFIATGYYMKYIRDHELFREDGYGSIWEFAEDNCGIKKSTASRWMSMNDKFSKGGNSPILAAEFRGFEKSQLQEMLYLDDKQIEEVTPDMTVKEIREVRKPAEPVIVLKKPDEKDREYLDAAAKHLINCLYDWFLQDHMNRVLLVDRSPEEIKKKLGKDHRWRCFSTATGTAQINLFDDCVQLWDEKNEYIGDFDWFYLAAAIQSMWNDVSLEKAQETLKEEKTSPIDRGCITGKNPNGNCVCCGKDGVECCGQCDDGCNSRCGWIDSVVATSQQDDSDPDGLVDMNPPEDVDDHADLREDPAGEVEKVEAEVVEDDELPVDGKFEELSDQTDMDLLRDLLEQEKYRLGLMREEYSENDIRVRKQKLIVGAYAGMIADLDICSDQNHEQPELPTFRNNDQRKEWLRNYKAWGLWYEDKNIGARYYKYNFQNGARLIVEEYVRELELCGELTSSYLHLVGGPEPPKKDCISKWQRHEVYARYQNSETELVEFLKYVQKGAKENADRKVDK